MVLLELRLQKLNIYIYHQQKKCLKAIVFKAIILQAVYFKLRISLSYKYFEELLPIISVKVDHATIQHWVFIFAPLAGQQFRMRKKSVKKRWRMDEIYSKVKG